MRISMTSTVHSLHVVQPRRNSLALHQINDDACGIIIAVTIRNMTLTQNTPYLFSLAHFNHIAQGLKRQSRTHSMFQKIQTTRIWAAKPREPMFSCLCKHSRAHACSSHLCLSPPHSALCWGFYTPGFSQAPRQMEI